LNYLSGDCNIVGGNTTTATSFLGNVDLVGGHALLVGDGVHRVALEGPGQEGVGVIGLVVGWKDFEALAIVGDLGLK